MSFDADDQQPVGPADALAFIDRSRARLAAASDTPPSRHLAFAAMMGGWVATLALPMVPRMTAVVLLMLALVLVVRWDRNRMGMFINGYRRGRTRWVTAAMLAAIMPLYALSCWFGIERHEAGMSLVLGLVAACLAYPASVWWCRVFRREMLGGLA